MIDKIDLEYFEKGWELGGLHGLPNRVEVLRIWKARVDKFMSDLKERNDRQGES